MFAWVFFSESSCFSSKRSTQSVDLTIFTMDVNLLLHFPGISFPNAGCGNDWKDRRQKWEGPCGVMYQRYWMLVSLSMNLLERFKDRLTLQSQRFVEVQSCISTFRQLVVANTLQELRSREAKARVVKEMRKRSEASGGLPSQLQEPCEPRFELWLVWDWLASKYQSTRRYHKFVP